MKKKAVVNVNVHFTPAEAKVLRDKMESMFGEVSAATKHFPRKADRLDAFHALDKIGMALNKLALAERNARMQKRLRAAKKAAAKTEKKVIKIPATGMTITPNKAK